MSDSTEASHVVTKIQNWNASLNWDWFKDISLQGGRPFNSEYYYGELILTDSANRNYFNGMEISKLFRTDGNYTKANVSSAFWGNTGIIYIISHGNGKAIYPETDDSEVNVSDLTGLSANSKVPVVVSIACMNGAFDSDIVYGAGTPFSTQGEASFGKGVLKSNAAGIAYIGGARVNYGAPDFTITNGYLEITKEPYMAGMLTDVFGAWASLGTHLGDITKEAMATYYSENVFSAGDINHVTWFEFVLLGDPALELPSRQAGPSYTQPTSTAVSPQGYVSNIPWYNTSSSITIHSTTNSSTVDTKRTDTYSDNTVETRTDGTVGGAFDYIFTGTTETEYLVRTEAEDGKEGWLYLRVIDPLTGAKVLVVDDDAGKDYDTFYENALAAKGYNFDSWNIKLRDQNPSYSTLAGYDTIIWLTGDEYQNTLTSTDQSNLTTYLDSGGTLFISGQDIGYDIGATSFYENYLHAYFVADDSGIKTLDGISGDPIGDGLTIGISGGDGADNQKYPSKISPHDVYATDVFNYAAGGCGAIRADTNTYRVVYFAFGFEGINSASDRNTVMGRVLDWLLPVVSCDESGTRKNAFAPGENVSVKGKWLSASTNYTIWIQPEGVTEGQTLDSNNDPSGTQETVKTDSNGSFGPQVIWSIPSGASATFQKWDIVLDKNGTGSGTYTAADDKIDSAITAGITAPVPELPTIVLFCSGLIILAGYIVLKKRRIKD